LHHRQAASVSAEPPPSLSSQALLLPPALLALPEGLTALQAQVAALHLQMADLTILLQQHAQPLPASSIPSAKKPSPTPHSRPAVAKTPPKPRHVIPRVEYREQGPYVVICPKKGLLPFVPDSPEWFAWVAEQDSFRFVGQHAHFTAHHEWRVPQGTWRSHRHIRNRSHTQRLAHSHKLTIAVLEHTATTIQALLA
jgi:hypothetical protein